MKTRLSFLFSFLFLLLAIACATSPLGRKQLVLMPEGQMNTLGAQAFEQVKEQTGTDPDPARNSYVRCVALPITEAARGRTSATSWDIVVFKDQTANAFALPGGKIGVNAGLLSVAKSDGQLAAVLGHEVGHVIARHSNERVSEGVVAQFGQAAASVLTKDNPHRGLILGALGVGTQFGVLLPHSRTQESEADLIGLDLMAEAGFDPRQSVELWKNMMTANPGAAPPEFLSTHPASDARIRNLEAHLPQAMAKYQKAQAAGQRPSCRLGR